MFNIFSIILSPSARSRFAAHAAASPPSPPPSSRLRRTDALEVLYTKATSLNGDKLRELSIISAQEKPHLIMITETWFDEHSAANLENYTLLRRDRGTRGGGVCIYVRRDLAATEIGKKQLSSQLLDSNVEQVWRAIKLDHTSVLIGCIYRSENNAEQGTIDKKIRESIRVARRAVKDRIYGAFLVAGDFNLRDLEWNEDGSIERSRATSPKNSS